MRRTLKDRLEDLIDGVAKVLDIGSAFDSDPLEENPWEKDAASVRRDWEAVGGDLQKAADKLRR